MKVGRKHRVNVRTDDVTWRRFKALCVESAVDMEVRLGELVAREVTRGATTKTKTSKRRETKALELRQALREAEASPPTKRRTKRSTGSATSTARKP